MGRTQPSKIAEHHGTTRRRFSACTLPMFHTPRRARRPKQHQPAPTRAAKKALPGRFIPNCGESTISAGRPLGLAHEFCGWGVQCGLASDPVTARDRVEGGHRGWWGV